jgi:hypothetical protein
MVPSLCISLSGKRKCLNFNKVGSVVASARPVMFLLYRVFQEEYTILNENFPYVKLHRCNRKHLYAKLNGYGDNGEIIFEEYNRH